TRQTRRGACAGRASSAARSPGAAPTGAKGTRAPRRSWTPPCAEEACGEEKRRWEDRARFRHAWAVYCVRQPRRRGSRPGPGDAGRVPRRCAMTESNPPAAVHPAPLAIGAEAPAFDLAAVNPRTAGARVRLQDVATKLFVYV